MEEIKKSRGKIGTNAYRTNMSTLKGFQIMSFLIFLLKSKKRKH